MKKYQIRIVLKYELEIQPPKFIFVISNDVMVPCGCSELK